MERLFAPFWVKIINMKEKWKNINGYESYKISELGKVFNKYGKELKQSKNTSGFLRVGLSKNKKSKEHKIHILVANHFLKKEKNYTGVKFKDGNRDICVVSNLEWYERGVDRVLPLNELIEYYSYLDKTNWFKDQENMLDYLISQDGNCLQDIFSRLYKIWYGFLLKVTENEEIAQDLLQNSYESFISSLNSGRFRIDSCNVKHSVDIYMKRLVRNSYTNWKRKYSKEILIDTNERYQDENYI